MSTTIHGGPWRCPYCGEVTMKIYRCVNPDDDVANCGKDLTDDKLEEVDQE